MNQHQTTVAERNHFIDLKLQGYSLQAIADETGWSWGCVRQWWRRYRAGGRPALDPEDGRQQRGGPMSRFPEEVRAAFTAIKEAHPGWGAPVARPRVAEQLAVPEEELPSLSTIEKYWAQHQPPLLRSYRRRPPASEPPPISEVTAPHERWQMDFKEWIAVSGVGHIDVLNIRDEATPVKIGSFVYPARKTTGRDIQEALRTAFTRWGLPDRLQTDRDKRLFNANHDYPFPSVVRLWLAGLDIRHDIALSAMDNGGVERFNRTWYERVALGGHFESPQALQTVSDNELHRLNHSLPSRGRACNGRPPLVAYPEAKTPRRPFWHDMELDLFSLQRVYDFLDTQVWWRRVSQVGQISLGGARYGLGIAYARQDVRLNFEADTAEFIVRTAQAEVIKRLAPKQLSVASITGLDPDSA